MLMSQSPGKGKEMAKGQKMGRGAARILAATYQVPINNYRRMINGWKGMTLPQKIGWTVGLLLFLAYPLMVFVHFAFLRKTF